MMQIIGILLMALTIFLTQALLKDNPWILNSSILKLILVGIGAIFLSILLAIVLDNFFILVIVTTLVWATILQIRFANRVTTYNQTGK